MAVSKLICPECETVLRPAKPLAAGKRVKCPKCGANFTAQEVDENEPARPKKGPSAIKAAHPPKKSSAGHDYDTYAVTKDADDEEQEEKEERGEEMLEQFLKQKKTKDPRGPAQAAITKPCNMLFITAVCGAIGYVILILLTVILNLMPAPKPEEVDERDSKTKTKYRGLVIGPGVAAVAEGKDPFAEERKEEAKKAEGAFGGAGLSTVTRLTWIAVIVVCFLYLLGIGYCAVIVFGVVQIQNLESRTWGIIASILVMVPIHGFGFMAITLSLLVLVAGFLYDSAFAVRSALIAGAVVEVAWGISIGILNLKTLMDPAVIAGFEYVEDE